MLAALEGQTLVQLDMLAGGNKRDRFGRERLGERVTGVDSTGRWVI